jgi:hypothetical protein
MVRVADRPIDVERLARRLRAERVRGWATVELDRAEREVVLPRGWPRAIPADDDLPLGATTRVASSPEGAETIVLLEPVTEGLLAASLARHGEAFLVDYLLVAGPLDEAVRRAREEGLTLSALSSGPFGPERLAAGSPRWGPHLILAGRDRKPDRGTGAVTIET